MPTYLLAADRVYRFMQSPAQNVSSYLTRFILALTPCGAAGGMVSVALSLKLLPVAVSNCLPLCGPDFPPILSYRRQATWQTLLV